MYTLALVATGVLAIASNIIATIVFAKMKKKGLIKCEHDPKE